MPAMPSDQQRGRWALVLGTSKGAGAAIARALARDVGLDIVGIHRGNHPEQARALEHDIGELGRRVHLLKQDGGSAEAALSGGARVAEIVGDGGLHMVVHSLANASIGAFMLDRPKRFQPRHFEKTFDCMAHSFVWWAQALDDAGLLGPGARILALNNPLQLSLIHGLGMITAAKAALEQYVRHMALELGPRGIRVNLLMFGAARTDAVIASLGKQVVDSGMQALGSAIPAGRSVTLEEVGRVAAFLAGDAAEWFNGATIDFTGGEVQSLYDYLLHPAGRKRKA